MTRTVLAVIAFAMVTAGPLAAGRALAQHAGRDSCLTANGAFIVLDFSSRSFDSELWIFGTLRSTVRKCADLDLLRQIKDGKDYDQLLDRGIVMAVIEESSQIKYYVIPHRGVAQQPPSESPCNDKQVKPERWKAILAAAIALHEKDRVSHNPCSDSQGNAAKLTVQILNQARGGLSASSRDLGERLLRQRLDARDIVKASSAAGCGPRDVNSRLIELRRS